MNQLLVLVRPKQWIKNIFVLVPVFFSGTSDANILGKAIIAFIAFSLLSSAVYILNDWCDIEVDRQHRRKRYRPLASGAVSTITAVCLGLVITASVSMISFIYNFTLFANLLLISYCLINIAYSFGLKHVSILEFFLLGSGFIIRLVFGAVVIGEGLSPWILICTGLLSMMLVIGKRRGELFQAESGKLKMQQLSKYTVPFLDQINMVLAASTFSAYMFFCSSAYAIDKFGKEVILTSPFVLFGILNYIKVLTVDGLGDDPIYLIFSDRNTQLTLVGWSLTFIVIFYY